MSWKKLSVKSPRCPQTSLLGNPFYLSPDNKPNLTSYPQGFSGGSDRKELACNAADSESTPGSGRSLGEGKGNLPQYSCLGNPMDGGACSPQSHIESDSTSDWAPPHTWPPTHLLCRGSSLRRKRWVLKTVINVSMTESIAPRGLIWYSIWQNWLKHAKTKEVEGWKWAFCPS